MPGVVARFIWNSITVGPSNKRWTVLTSGVCDTGRVDFEALFDSPVNAEIEGLTECFGVTHATSTGERPASQDYPRDQWPLLAAWERISAQAVVPYDIHSRKERYREAYDTMRSMIDYYKKAKEKNRGS